MILLPDFIALLWDQFWSFEPRLCQTFVRAICHVTSRARFANGACCYEPTIPLAKGTYQRGDLFQKWKGVKSLLLRPSKHWATCRADRGFFPHATGENTFIKLIFLTHLHQMFVFWYSTTRCQWWSDWWLSLNGFSCEFLTLRNVYLDFAPKNRWPLKGMFIWSRRSQVILDKWFSPASTRYFGTSMTLLLYKIPPCL